MIIDFTLSSYTLRPYINILNNLLNNNSNRAEDEDQAQSQAEDCHSIKKNDCEDNI